MKPQSLIDELSQVRMAIKALRQHEVDLVTTLVKDVGYGKHCGDTATIAIRERKRQVLDKSLLPPEIVNDRKYWKSESTHKLKVIKPDTAHEMPDPSIVFKGDIVAIARRWAV